MFYKNTDRLARVTRLVCVILLLVLEVISYHLTVDKTCSDSITIRCTGRIVYASFVSPQPSESSFMNWLTSIGSLLTGISGFALAIAKLLNWLKWRLKYGKNRTPVVFRPSIFETI